MENNLKIGFGILVPKLNVQLKKQGFIFDKEKVKHFEKLRESINYLRFANILNDSETNKATQKLFNEIKKHINNKNKI
jgi:hypothetical protein